MSQDETVQAEDEKQLEEDTSTNQTEETTEDSNHDESNEGSETANESNEASQDAEKDTEAKERPVYTMPVAKAQEEKKKAVMRAKEEAEAEIAKVREEYEARLKTAQSSSQEANTIDAKLAEVAEKHGLKTDAAKDLLDVFKSSIELPDLSKYNDIVKEKELEGHKTQVSNEFDESVLPLIKKDFPNATQSHIDEVKKRVTELAFSKGYNTYRIEDIYRVKQDDFKFKVGFSAETSGGHSAELVDFDKMTDKEEHELARSNPEKYQQYLKYMVSNQGSRYID